jgi:DNA modification methylase
MINWKLETVKIKELRDHPKNPRQITKDQVVHLENLITKFGLIDKPILNLDKMIIGGHQRIRVLKKMKVKEVECWIPDRQLEQAEIDHLCIGLNLNQGQFDYDILANEWDALDLLKWGFTEEQLLGAASEVTELDSEIEEDEALKPAKDEDAVTQLGDLYELGEHRLICGDSTSLEVLDILINGNKIEMVYTDPPYGINVKISDGKQHGNAKTKRSKFNDILNDESNQTAKDAFNYCVALNIPVMIWWGANYYPEVLPISSCWIVWDKNTGTNNFPDAELAWCSDKSPVRIFKHTWNGMIKESEQGQKRQHPTQKPIALAEWCISKYGNELNTVMDLFVGSGSTLIACEKLNKKFFGIELSPAYCDVIVKRYINYMAKKGKVAEIRKNGEAILHEDYD